MREDPRDFEPFYAWDLPTDSEDEEVTDGVPR